MNDRRGAPIVDDPMNSRSIWNHVIILTSIQPEHMHTINDLTTRLSTHKKLEDYSLLLEEQVERALVKAVE